MTRGARLGRRLRLAFAVPIAALAVGALAATASLAAVTRQVDELHAQEQTLDQGNAELLQRMIDARTALQQYVVTGSFETRTAYETAQERFAAGLERARAGSPVGSRARALVDRQASLAADWTEKAGDPVAALGTEALRSPGLADLSAEGERIFSELRATNEETVAFIDAEELANRNAIHQTATLLGWLLAALTLASLLAGVFIARRTTNYVADPLERIGKSLERLALGDLGTRIAPEGPVEVREVAEALNLLASSNQTLSRIQNERSARDRVIGDTCRRIRRHLEIDPLLRQVVEELGVALDAERAFIRLAEGDVFGPIRAEWRTPGLEPLGLDPPGIDPVMVLAYLRRLADPGAALAIDDVTGRTGFDERSRRALFEMGLRSVLVVPLLAGPDAIGVLVVSTGSVHHWTEHEKAVAEAVARETGVALSHAQSYERERETVTKLRELDQVKSDFVSSISHELRTPLGSIMGYTELLLDGDGGEMTEPQVHALEVVARNARRLRILVEDLLTLSKIESGGFKLTFGPVDTDELVEGVVEVLAPSIAERSLVFDKVVDTATGVFLGDGEQLERVLLNLLGNAIKFTPPGGRVSLSATREIESISFTVTDTGVGIPEEEQGRLFTRFFRSTRSHEAHIQGTGLGLAIAKGIVDGHGGRIQVWSRENEGTKVTVRIPALSATAPTTPPRMAQAPPDVSAGGRPLSRKAAS